MAIPDDFIYLYVLNDILGIHPNFGRCSYFQINEIQSVYHCSQEEIIELLLSIQDMLTTIDKM